MAIAIVGASDVLSRLHLKQECYCPLPLRIGKRAYFRLSDSLSPQATDTAQVRSVQSVVKGLKVRRVIVISAPWIGTDTRKGEFRLIGKGDLSVSRNGHGLLSAVRVTATTARKKRSHQKIQT